MNRSKEIFKNQIKVSTYNKAAKTKNKYLKKYGDDTKANYILGVEEIKTLRDYLGVRNIVTKKTNEVIESEKSIIIGNIRMGFGHYIDHELVYNLKNDCEKRIERIKGKKAKRVIITIGGAGAQKEIYIAIIRKLLPKIRENNIVLYINVGNHKSVYEDFVMKFQN